MNQSPKNKGLKFLSIGAKSGMNEWEVRRIWLLNAFYFVSTLTFIVVTIQTFWNDGTEQGFAVLALALFFQLGLIPLSLHKIGLAEFYFLLIGNVTLFVMGNYYGPEAGSFLFYFPFLLIISFLVDFKKPVLATVHLGLTCGFIIAGLLIQHKFLYHPYPADVLLNSYNFNFLVSCLATASIMLIIVRMSYNQHQQFLDRLQERLMAEERMKNSIREKETLLAEVHHRVKNNLAVITSLLNLQMNVVTNDYTRNVLRESRNRVSSMALIHQKLYQNSNVEQIDFGSYASELVSEIKNSYPDNTADKIQVSLEAEHIPLSLTKAIPAGLLLNELLSNCYKHAFQGKTNGNIFIRFKKTDSNCQLEVEDNGVGLSGDFKIGNQVTLGMTIIQSLAEQIDAKISMTGNSGSGTKVIIEFSA